MSRIAQKEDLSRPRRDPGLRQAGAARPRRLTALYLLTVADIRGTSPKVWNAWKGKLLEDLYRLTLRALGGAKPNLDAEIESRKQEARQLLALHSALPGTEEPLWKTLDVSYFARHDAGRHRLARALAVAPRATRASRWCARGRRRSATACRCWCTRPTARTCSRASAATSTAPASASRTPRSTPPAPAIALDTFQVDQHALRARRPVGLPRPDLAGRDAARRWRCRRPARCPSRPRPRVAPRALASRSRRASRCDPDERAQRWLLERQRQRPLRPALRHRPRAGAPPHQPAAGQDQHAGRAGRGHLPGRRPGAAAERARSCRSRASCSTR